MSASTRRLLVVTEPRLGDIVVAHPLFRLLKESDPALEIDALIPSMYKDLVARMPEISQQWHLDVKRISLWSRESRHICANIRRAGYEQAIVMTRSSSACALVLLSGIKIRTGYEQVRPFLLNDLRGRMPGILMQKTVGLLPKHIPPPASEDFPYPRLSTNEREISDTLSRFGLNRSSKPLITVAPGAIAWATKKWPIENFVELCRMLVANFQLCILGGEAERPLGQVIATAIPEAKDLCGRSSIDEAVNIIAAARCMVANDSGLLHVAAAVGTPLVGIYGSTSPIDCPPWTHARAILWKSLECSPCYQNQCPLGHHACMTGIEPQEALVALSSLISVPGYEPCHKPSNP